MYRMMIFAVAPMALVFGTIAEAKTPAAKMLVQSSPAQDSVQNEAVASVKLDFAEPVELLGVTIYGAPEGVIEAFEKDYSTKKPATKRRTFTIKLPAPLTHAGTYKFSYLVTCKSVPSLNGFIDFTIAEPAKPSSELR